MKQAAQKTASTPKSNSPALVTLKKKMDSAERAVLKAYTDFEKKQSAHKESLQNESDKHVVFQLWSVMRIAKFAFKIKRTELKLAKSEYKFAKKAAKKAGQKANKESAITEARASKPVEKKKKATKKTAAT